ncbi:hypothetical protein ACLGI4_17075 [Streptomyces sp. HMX112]|uniref:hypothetical protein n=1 Tax=Streptomyces sp. HMX112 TaxID=3390850 RepID=UPI003A80956B
MDLPVRVLKQVAVFLRSLTAEEAEALANGQSRLACVPVHRRGSGKKAQDQPVPDPDKVRSALTALSSREEGNDYVRTLGLNKEGLRTLADALDLPMSRSETVEGIIDRIVEATIGYRIRSEAIRGREN